MEELQSRHRKEQRDLQAKITQKKKQTTKKTRKGVNDECADLERRLRERQRTELAACDGGNLSDASNDSSEDHPFLESASEQANGNSKQERVSNLTDSARGLSITDTGTTPTQPKKLNRQKARLAKRAAEQEALAAEAAQEATNLPDLRQTERAAMLKEFEQYGLKEKEIRPDGHCLYSAVADQLNQIGVGLIPQISPQIASSETDTSPVGLVDYKIVRYAAADFMSQNPDDFIPFLEEPLNDYTNKIKNTAEWGGQLELLALAKAFGVEIHVVQSSSRLEKIVPGTSTEGKTIWLAYYRHNFGLGEHYNSLRKGP
ncbi:hypothetical protein MMC16_001976 [Acarospora aff. strigata]|nr:hypothetical protein [Acarospora aff. strigata]